MENKLEYDKYNSWVGIGAKGGGILGFVGFETVEGKVWNLSGLQSNSFSIGGLRLGAGLGGGIGAVAIFIFNCQNIYNLNGKDLSNYAAQPGQPVSSVGATDVNINVSLGGKWSDISKLFSKKGLANKTIKLLKNGLKLKPGDLGEFRNLGHHIYNLIDITSMDKSPKVVTIDVPATSIGVEVSAYILAGTAFSISAPTS